MMEFSYDGVFITAGASGIPASIFNLPTGVAVNKNNGMHYVT
jgi:hypothetical protein